MSLLKEFKGTMLLGVCTSGLFLSLSTTCAVPAMAADAAASGAAASGDYLEEVVVTARRRVESLQSVPIAITAISADRLEQMNLVQDSDVLKGVPSVGVHSPFADSTYIAIRGQDGKGAVVTYQNEVPIVSQGPNEPFGVGVGGPAMMYDMENVQVLKGPQGTLFGRNTTGGAVLFRTKMPTAELGGSIAAEYGNYNSREVTGVFNTPLGSDKLLFRVAGTLVQRDGYTHVISEPSYPNGVDTYNRNAYSFRATLTMKPSDEAQNDIIVQYMKNKNHGSSVILKAYDPNFFGGFINVLFPNLASLVAQQAALGPRTQIPVGNDSAYEANFTTATDILRMDISDHITLRNIANFSQFKITQEAVDGDGTIYGICDCLGSYATPQINAQYSDEFQVQGKSFANTLVWTAGLFFLDAPPQSDFNVQFNHFFGSVSYNEYRSGTESKAVYGQGTYDLSAVVPGLKFTGGVRYTQDRFFDSVRKGLPAIDTCPPALLATKQNADALCTQTATGVFTAPTWTVGFDYQLAPRSLAYVVSRRGYREGGINPGSASAAYSTFAPEYVTDVELGFKSDWFVGDAKIRTNFDVFRQWYTGIQAENLEPGAGTTITFVTRNGPSAVISGAEFEGIIEPVKSVELGLTASYLNSAYSYTGLDAAAAAELQNDVLQDKPRFKYTVDARYHLPVPDQLGDISVSANWDWQSLTVNVKSAPDHPYDQQTAYGLLSFNALWDNIAGHPISASFFMNNATNKLYAVGSYALEPALGFAGVTYGEPRMYGIRLKYKFGGEAH